MPSSSLFNMEQISSKRKATLLSIALFVLLFERQWSWLFNRTVLESSFVIYVLFLSVFALFILLLFKYPIRGSKCTNIWIPYFLLTIISCLINFDFQYLAYWLSYFVILLVASKSDFCDSVPIKLIYWTGIIAMIGVYIQFLFLPFYNTVFAPLIKADAVRTLEEAYGMRGFSPQQGTTSIMLIYGEIAALFFKDQVVSKIISKRKILYWLFVGLLIFSIFLTGKRMMSLIAIVMPVIVYYFSRQRSSKRILYALLILLSAIIIYEFILPILVQNTNVFFFKRLGQTMDAFNAGEDVTSDREFLWDLAMNAFHSHPFLGIGVGKYQTFTGIEMGTHNTYLQVLCEQGAVGLSFYVLGLLTSLLYTINLLRKTTNTIYKPYLLAAFAMQVVYLMYAYTGNVNGDADAAFYFLGVGIVINIGKSNYRV